MVILILDKYYVMFKMCVLPSCMDFCCYFLNMLSFTANSEDIRCMSLSVTLFDTLDLPLAKCCRYLHQGYRDKNDIKILVVSSSLVLSVKFLTMVTFADDMFHL